MLKEEPEYNCWQDEEAATHHGAEDHPGQRHNPGIHLQISLGVSLSIECIEVAADRLAITCRIALKALLRLRVDAMVVQSIRMGADTIGRLFQIVPWRVDIGRHSHTAFQAAAARFAAGDPAGGNAVKSPRMALSPYRSRSISS